MKTRDLLTFRMDFIQYFWTKAKDPYLSPSSAVVKNHQALKFLTGSIGKQEPKLMVSRNVFTRVKIHSLHIVSFSWIQKGLMRRILILGHFIPCRF